MLKEGGYEADTIMIYYGQPEPFTEAVKATVFGAIHAVMKQAGSAR